MDIEKLKNQAVIYARQLAEDETAPFDFAGEDYTVQEWYLVITLAQIYYNLIKKIYTREEAKQKQVEAFEFVKQHYDIFEEMEE